MDSRKIKNQEEFFELLADPDMSLQLESLFEQLYENEETKMFYSDVQSVDNNSTPKRVYAFSNEQLDGFFKEFDMTGKKLLTVGSSFDQALSAIFKGSTDVTVIDLNMYAKFFGELKMAAIKNLSFEDFRDFFTFDLSFTDYVRLQEDWDCYAKLSHDLSKETQVFWDTLMYDSDTYLFRNMFHYEFRRVSKFYKNEEDYLKLQNILRTKKIKTNFITAEFLNFPKMLKEKFDVIMLSNIRGYYMNYSPFYDVKKFYSVCKKLYNKNLNPEGLMQIDSSVYMSEEKKSLREFELNDINEKIGADKIFIIPNSGLGAGVDSIVVQKENPQKEPAK